MTVNFSRKGGSNNSEKWSNSKDIRKADAPALANKFHVESGEKRERNLI